MPIQEAIQEMFRELITVVPITTAILYLRKLFPGMTEETAINALNRAIFDLQCNYDKETGLISMYKGPSVSKLRMEAKTKTFRIAVELMDAQQEIMQTAFPFEYHVINGNKLYEISYIYNGQETPVSLAVQSRYIEPDNRNSVRRIAVVDYGVDTSYIKRVGFSKIVRVTPSNDIEIVEKIPQTEAWLDLDE